MLRPDQLGGGALARRDDSTHVVTLWVVPDGWDLSKAVCVNVFFSDCEAAKQFAFLHKNPPAMASMAVITHHDLVAERFNRMFGE